MTRSIDKSGPGFSDSGKASSEGASPPAPHAGLAAGQLGGAFNETGGVTLAALLHLIRLMGAELALARSGGGPDRLEQAVRAKIGQFLSPTSNAHVHDEGMALARHLVEQVLAQIRGQAQLQQSLTSVSRREAATPVPQRSAPLSTLLN
jgi:hypothetical protein